MFTNENFINAIFSNSERTTVEIFYKHVDDSTQTHHVDLSGENNPDIDKLLDIISIEQIEYNTAESKRVERRSFEESVLRIAKGSGILDELLKKMFNEQFEILDKKRQIDPDSALRLFLKERQTEFFELLFNFLLNQDLVEELFNFKIWLFEHEILQKSKNSKIKTQIRKAKTPLEAFKYFIKIWEENN